MKQQTSLAWYREPVMWLVVGIPVSAVLFGVVMISLALTSDDGLVVDDYYKQGLQINRSLARDKYAAQLGLEARVKLDWAQRRVWVELTWPVSASFPDRLELSFLHATRQDEDRRISLIYDGQGGYSGALPSLVTGRWYVRVATDRWRLQTTARLPDTSLLVLRPEKLPERADAG